MGWDKNSLIIEIKQSIDDDEEEKDNEEDDNNNNYGKCNKKGEKERAEWNNYCAKLHNTILITSSACVQVTIDPCKATPTSLYPE